MIKFGTDGWRGLIARDFTFENVRYVALATAEFVNSKSDSPSVVIGYDSRFLSKEFAHETALVLAWRGVKVFLADSISSTPQVSYHTKYKNADFGVVITASHNPPQYNGYKLKAGFGGPATPDQVKELEDNLQRILAAQPDFDLNTLEEYQKEGLISLFDAKKEYLDYIREKIDVDGIARAGVKTLFDPMYGANINTIQQLLPEAYEIHDFHNPGFGELDHLEPIEEYLGELISIVKEEDYQIGIAFDGDADRLGLVDEDGNFVDAHKIFMILLKYLYEEKGLRGVVAKTVSLTTMVDLFCEKHKIDLRLTPVGFKHIAKIMNEEKTLIGGEESGGLSSIVHIPERDGLFNALMILEIMAKRGKSLNELCEELDSEFGPHLFRRRDVRVSEETKQAVLSACAKKPNTLGKYAVRNISTIDGFKFYVDGGWLLIRASGTEPLLRFYAEAENMDKVDELLEAGLNLK